MSRLSGILSETRLEQYNDKFAEDGFILDDLLGSESIEELDGILKNVGLKPAHRLRLKRKLWKMKVGNSNANQRHNNTNQNSNNGNDDNDGHSVSSNNDNVTDEISKMREEFEVMRLQVEQDRIEAQKKIQEEEKTQEQEIHRKTCFDSNFNFENLLRQNLSIQNNCNKNISSFPVIYDQGDNTITLYGFKKSHTVKELFKSYAKNVYASDVDNLLTRFDLTYGIIRLTQNDWSKRLDSIGMGSNLQGEFVSVILDVDGGSTKNKVRILRKNSGLNIVKGECCILKLEEECAKMKCNHLISAFAMYNYIKSVIEKNMHIHKILCPVPKCGKIWDWNTCCLVGDLSQDEYIGYTTVIKRRENLASGAFKCCPFCKVLIKRPQKLGMNRVRCSKCKKADFCYICLSKWCASGFTLCGNKNCLLYEKQKKLLNCPKIKKDEKHKYSYYDTLDIPIYRACPKCYRFIQHKSACKHITCPGCSFKFCFICLGIYKNSKWPCVLNGKNTDHTLGCNLAPRQKLG